MSGLLGLSRAIDFLNVRIGKVVAWAIVVAVVVSAVNAIIRKVFGTSSNAWLELQWYLFGAVFMLCASWTLKANEHIRIDIFSSRLSKRGRDWIDIVGHLFFLLPFVLVMLYLSWPFFLRSAGLIGTSPWPFVEMLVRLVLAGICLAALVLMIARRHEATPFSRAIALGLGAFFVHLFIDFMKQAGALYDGLFPRWEVSTNAGGLIIWPAKALILVGIVLLFFQWLSELIKRIAIMQGLVEDEHAAGGGHAAAAEAEAERLLQELAQTNKAAGEMPGDGVR